MAWIGESCAFSEENEIAVLDGERKSPLVESFRLGGRLNCSHMRWEGESHFWLEIFTERWVLRLPFLFRKKDLLQLPEIKDHRQLL